MDKQKLERANRLDGIIQSHSDLINKYCLGFDCDVQRLGYALRAIEEINPDLCVDIKSAIKKAFDSIKNEFESM